MANKDDAKGFYPIRHLTGGEMRVQEYILTTNAVTFQGEVLKIVSTGTVEQAAADDATIVVGIAAHAAGTSSSSGVKVGVYDDPNIIFGIQTKTGETPTAADIGAGANHVAGTGDTVTGLSTDELDTIGTGAKQFKVMGLIDRQGNTYGEHNDLMVIFNEHFYHGSRPDSL